jgi:cysteinyl-tRNA synthetase
VLRLWNARTGRTEVVKPTHPGKLRVYHSGPAIPGDGHLVDLRCYLLTDLIRRCAERRGLLVTVAEPTPSREDAVLARLRADLTALNVHPAERATAQFPPGGLALNGAGRFDVRSGCAIPNAGGEEVAGHLVAGGSVLFEGREMTAPGFGVRLRDVTSRGLDPLALRLAFLWERYRQPLNLTWDTLGTAEETLLRWRDLVAGWAQSPSTAMSSRYADAVTAAFDDDLDTPAALAALRSLEADESVRDGTKFETFAALDHLLGLDLARDIGKPRPARS